MLGEANCHHGRETYIGSFHLSGWLDENYLPQEIQEDSCLKVRASIQPPWWSPSRPMCFSDPNKWGEPGLLHRGTSVCVVGVCVCVSMCFCFLSFFFLRGARSVEVFWATRKPACWRSSILRHFHLQCRGCITNLRATR